MASLIRADARESLGAAAGAPGQGVSAGPNTGGAVGPGGAVAPTTATRAEGPPAAGSVPLPPLEQAPAEPWQCRSRPAATSMRWAFTTLVVLTSKVCPAGTRIRR